MPALVADSASNAKLSKIATATHLHVVSGSPATRATVLSSSLANVAVVAGDFTIGAGTPDGRRLTVAAKSGVAVTGTGTPAHYCLIDGTELLYRTEVDPLSPSLTQGSTTSIPSITYDDNQPTFA